MNSISLKIQILDKEYQVNCAPEEKEVLLESATLVNNKMEEIRKSSSIIGLERIAVMTALNLAHDVIDGKNSNTENSSASKVFKNLDIKVSEALLELQS
ncbi:MAG: cell division protein ZapA [Pseudomonadota bacterium]|nr:cell division protein ZapA [Pseudomonadota bacterium]MED5310331.1 cell division protein ZapA [Pseudomonadota bacterium]